MNLKNKTNQSAFTKVTADKEGETTMKFHLVIKAMGGSMNEAEITEEVLNEAKSMMKSQMEEAEIILAEAKINPGENSINLREAICQLAKIQQIIEVIDDDLKELMGN